MVLCEDRECTICFLPYSRQDRVPRMIHCRHTFCEPCLETLSQSHSGLRTVGCPLCRRVTCIQHGVSLQEALWVNSWVWDQIPEDAEEEGLKEENEEESVEAERRPSNQAQRSFRTKLKLPVFFRKFRFKKQREERIVVSGNVEMKSWRRLSAEDTDQQ
ncbi:RING finger protein 208 [Thalassophryne amazonica]|uniref:RING finger protein 208 n=1 Tax=Thalassophryne amazonica TaxID=390379 RepID=UPI0014717C4A|nr:RING finger protein 208 [Thalassophryne amazonica]